MNQDLIDEVIQQWRVARPDLDPAPLAVVGRILRLAGQLESRANEALKPFEITVGGFDVLGTLRRCGPPYCMTPTQLMRSVMLSSGAMTNRIDRLQAQGLVERRPDPEDRRSLRVGLTSKGLQLIEQAAAVRFEEAGDAVGDLSPKEEQLLAALLHKVALRVDAGRQS